MSEEIKRFYELGYIIAPSISEGEIEKEVDVLKGYIQTLGNTISSVGAPEFIDLAYTMEKNIASKKMKYNQGYFGWIKFDATPESMESLKKSLDSNTLLVRYILIKTNIENNIIFKKPKLEAKRFQEMAEIDGSTVAISEDELSNEVVDLHNEHENIPVVEKGVQTEGSEEESL